MHQHRFHISVALVGAAVLVLAACGGSSTTAKSTATSAGPKTLVAAPGFDPSTNTIHLGVITPLTGPVAAIGKPLTSGTETWFKYLNANGGVGGKYKVVLDEEDSQYTPALGVQAYNKIKGNDVLIAQLLGTPVTSAVLPLLKADNIVAAPASLDATWVHDPNLIPVGAPYQIQMINAADYIYNTLGMKTSVVCSFIQDDTYGQAGQAGIDFAAQKLGYTIKSTAKYAATATDFTAQVQQLKSAGCEVVYLVDTPAITGKVFATAAQLQFTPQWVGQSPSYIGALAKSPLAPYLQAHFLIASEGTEWGDTSVKGMVDLLARQQQYAPGQAPDYYYAFGYYEAWAVTDILNKAVELGDLSRQGIITAMTKVGTMTFDGLSGDYSYGTGPGDRNPPRETTIFKINPAKPIGIEKVKVNFTSDLAKQYVFPAG